MEEQKQARRDREAEVQVRQPSQLVWPPLASPPRPRALPCCASQHSRGWPLGGRRSGRALAFGRQDRCTHRCQQRSCSPREAARQSLLQANGGPSNPHPPPAHPLPTPTPRLLQAMHAARHVRRLDPVTGRAHAAGKRKTSVALVWLRPASSPGAGRLVVNRRPYDEYFPDLLRRNDLAAPFLGEWGHAGGTGPASQPATAAGWARHRVQPRLPCHVQQQRSHAAARAPACLFSVAPSLRMLFMYAQRWKSRAGKPGQEAP